MSGTETREELIELSQFLTKAKQNGGNLFNHVKEKMDKYPNALYGADETAENDIGTVNPTDLDTVNPANLESVDDTDSDTTGPWDINYII